MRGFDVAIKSLVLSSQCSTFFKFFDPFDLFLTEVMNSAYGRIDQFGCFPEFSIFQPSMTSVRHVAQSCEIFD